MKSDAHIGEWTCGKRTSVTHWSLNSSHIRHSQEGGELQSSHRAPREDWLCWDGQVQTTPVYSTMIKALTMCSSELGCHRVGLCQLILMLAEPMRPSPYVPSTHLPVFSHIVLLVNVHKNAPHFYFLSLFKVTTSVLFPFKVVKDWKRDLCHIEILKCMSSS